MRRESSRSAASDKRRSPTLRFTLNVTNTCMPKTPTPPSPIAKTIHPRIAARTIDKVTVFSALFTDKNLERMNLSTTLTLHCTRYPNHSTTFQFHSLTIVYVADPKATAIRRARPSIGCKTSNIRVMGRAVETVLAGAKVGPYQ